MTKEKESEIKSLMSTLDISYEEAKELWEFDHDEKENAEVEELTKKANTNKTTLRERSKVTNTTPAKKERKIDDEKKFLLALVAEALKDKATITGQKNEVELNFLYNFNNYSIKLTKHRQKN